MQKKKEKKGGVTTIIIVCTTMIIMCTTIIIMVCESGTTMILVHTRLRYHDDYRVYKKPTVIM